MARILIVEDEAIVVLALTMELEELGHHVVVAYDGKAGLQVALEFLPDIVVADYMMPKMDGVAMLNAFLAHDLHPSMILHTAVPHSQLPPVNGQYTYVQKPTTGSELANIIEALIDKKE